MTDEPNPIPTSSPAPAAPHGEPVSGGNAPFVSRGTRSLTDRSPTPPTPGTEAAAGKISAAEPAPELENGPRIWPRVVGVLILLAGVGGVFAWQDPAAVRRLTGLSLSGLSLSGGGDEAMKTMAARVAKLEQRPVPTDTSGLAARLDVLEKRVAAQSAADPGPISARLDALEARVKDPSATPVPVLTAAGEVDLRPLLTRLEALEKRAAEPSKLDAITARIDTLTARDPADALRGRFDEIERQIAGLVAKDTSLAETSGRTARLARLDAAAIALANGRKLGAIPDASPALAKFADAVPPTEAALRLAFPGVVKAALKVSVPDTEGKPFFDRALARLQDFRLITIREGDHVVIGNATAEILAHAQTLLTAGDLTGAVRAVAAVSGPPAEKLAAWLADATALDAARAALAALASNG